MRTLSRGDLMNFIEKNTKKVALFVCLATAASGITTVFAAQDAAGWHGKGADRIYKVDGLAKVNAWIFESDGTYYVDALGHPVTSEFKVIDGKTYYFNAEGKKVSGATIIGGKRYFFDKNGVLPLGWSEDKTAYYNEFGVKLTGIQEIDGKTYNFGDAGTLQNGWKDVNGKSVYFHNGELASGEIVLHGKKYNFNTDGTLSKGWVRVGEEKAYYDDYGYRIHGWKEIDGKKYYFNKEGFAATDTEYAGYSFDSDGVASKIEEKEETSNGFDTATSGSIPNAKGGVAAAALAQLGRFQDCTSLVSNALAAQGIYHHGWPASYFSLGTVTSDPQPGDLIYYANGGTGLAHIAVYIGNGQAVHGGWRGNQTVIASAYVGSGPVFIRLR